MRNESVGKRTTSTSPHYNLITTWFSLFWKLSQKKGYKKHSQQFRRIMLTSTFRFLAMADALPAVEGDGNQDGNRGLTEQQRRERQRNIQLHIALIEHASRCNSPSCTSQNCVKMKIYLKHSQSCNIKASGGCEILTLLLSYNKTLSWFHGNEEFLL